MDEAMVLTLDDHDKNRIVVRLSAVESVSEFTASNGGCKVTMASGASYFVKEPMHEVLDMVGCDDGIITTNFGPVAEDDE